MIKFCFWAFALYCVFVAFTREDVEMVGGTETVPSSSSSSSYSSSESSESSSESSESSSESSESSSESSESSSESSESDNTDLYQDDPELAFAVAWLEILLPLQREPLSFEESTLLFLAEPNSALTRGNYALLLHNRKNVYENLGNLEPPEDAVSVYEPFAVVCLELSDDMKSLRNIVVNVLIDVESKSGFYKFGTKYLPVSEKIQELDKLAIPVMNYLEGKYSNEYLMEQAPHLFES